MRTQQAQPAAQLLLGRLLAGLGPLPLIGEDATLAALDSLHQAVRGGLDPAGGPATSPQWQLVGETAQLAYPSMGDEVTPT